MKGTTTMTVHTRATAAAIARMYLALETGQGVGTAAQDLAETASRLLGELERRPVDVYVVEPTPLWRRFAAPWQRRRATPGYTGRHHQRAPLAIEAIPAIEAAPADVRTELRLAEPIAADPDATIVIDGELIRQAVESR